MARGGVPLLHRDIHSDVREPVGGCILCPRNPPDRYVVKTVHERSGRNGEGTQAIVLDLPTPFELRADKFRIDQQFQIRHAALERKRKTRDHRLILGHIIGCDSDTTAQLFDDLAVFAAQNNADAGGPGIPARAPVGVEDRLHWLGNNEDATAVVTPLQTAFCTEAFDLASRQFRVTSLTGPADEGGSTHTMFCCTQLLVQRQD